MEEGSREEEGGGGRDKGRIGFYQLNQRSIEDQLGRPSALKGHRRKQEDGGESEAAPRLLVTGRRRRPLLRQRRCCWRRWGASDWLTDTGGSTPFQRYFWPTGCSHCDICSFFEKTFNADTTSEGKTRKFHVILTLFSEDFNLFYQC